MAETEAGPVVRIEQDSDGGVGIIRIRGKLTGGEECTKVRDAFADEIQEHPSGIAVNLEGIPWLNSSGLGSILAGYLGARDASVRVVFCSPMERVAAILRTTGLDSILEIIASEGEAVGRLKSG